MNGKSIWRDRLYKELAELELKGSVLDLGGSRNSTYTNNFKGEFSFSVLNLEVEDDRDIEGNLEEELPIESQIYDHVLAINVLEHIYNHRELISETHRILKINGKATIAVPFLIPFHPSPNDYWRYTETTLERLFTESGFSDVEVKVIGTGVFGSVAMMLFNVLHFSVLRWFVKTVATGLDMILNKLARKGTYSGRFYPLGYLVTATKKA